MPRPKGRQERGVKITVHPDVARKLNEWDEQLKNSGINLDKPQISKLMFNEIKDKKLDINIDVLNENEKRKRKEGKGFII